MEGRVLIVDPDASTCELLRVALQHDGFGVEVTTDPELIPDESYDVVIADIGLDLLGRIKARSPSTEVVLTTCDARLSDARAALRRGAFDFVLKPFYLDDLSLTVACAIARRRGRGLDDPFGFIRKNHELLR